MISYCCVHFRVVVVFTLPATHRNKTNNVVDCLPSPSQMSTFAITPGAIFWVRVAVAIIWAVTVCLTCVAQRDAESGRRVTCGSNNDILVHVRDAVDQSIIVHQTEYVMFWLLVVRLTATFSCPWQKTLHAASRALLFWSSVIALLFMSLSTQL